MANCRDCENMLLGNTRESGITESGYKCYCKVKCEYRDPDSERCKDKDRERNDYFQVRKPINNSSSSCFLTTLATSDVNITENGMYLETLRDFRNNVMHGDEKYADILKEYDVLGPMICDRINEDPEKDHICEVMVENFIKPTCYEIVSGNNDLAVLMYQKMVRDLQTKYEIEVNLDEWEYAPEVLEKQKGHGRARIIKNN